MQTSQKISLCEIRNGLMLSPLAEWNLLGKRMKLRITMKEADEYMEELLLMKNASSSLSALPPLPTQPSFPSFSLHQGVESTFLPTLNDYSIPLSQLVAKLPRVAPKIGLLERFLTAKVSNSRSSWYIKIAKLSIRKGNTQKEWLEEVLSCLFRRIEYLSESLLLERGRDISLFSYQVGHMRRFISWNLIDQSVRSDLLGECVLNRIPRPKSDASYVSLIILLSIVVRDWLQFDKDLAQRIYGRIILPLDKILQEGMRGKLPANIIHLYEDTLTFFQRYIMRSLSHLSFPHVPPSQPLDPSDEFALFKSRSVLAKHSIHYLHRLFNLDEIIAYHYQVRLMQLLHQVEDTSSLSIDPFHALLQSYPDAIHLLIQWPLSTHPNAPMRAVITSMLLKGMDLPSDCNLSKLCADALLQACCQPDHLECCIIFAYNVMVMKILSPKDVLRKIVTTALLSKDAHRMAIATLLQSLPFFSYENASGYVNERMVLLKHSGIDPLALESTPSMSFIQPMDILLQSVPYDQVLIGCCTYGLSKGLMEIMDRLPSLSTSEQVLLSCYPQVIRLVKLLGKRNAFVSLLSTPPPEPIHPIEDPTYPLTIENSVWHVRSVREHVKTGYEGEGRKSLLQLAIQQILTRKEYLILSVCALQDAHLLLSCFLDAFLEGMSDRSVGVLDTFLQALTIDDKDTNMMIAKVLIWVLGSVEDQLSQHKSKAITVLEKLLSVASLEVEGFASEDTIEDSLGRLQQCLCVVYAFVSTMWSLLPIPLLSSFIPLLVSTLKQPRVYLGGYMRLYDVGVRLIFSINPDFYDAAFAEEISHYMPPGDPRVSLFKPVTLPLDGEDPHEYIEGCPQMGITPNMLQAQVQSKPPLLIHQRRNPKRKHTEMEG